MIKKLQVMHLFICMILCLYFEYSMASLVNGESDQSYYTFYDNKHKVLAKFPKTLMYRLSKVIAKSANFGDHAEFIITLSNKPGDSRFQLSRESWELLLTYLQAHEREWQSDENRGAVYQALQDIDKAREIVVLDLLYFSCRYQFEELQHYLIPYVVSIWRKYQGPLQRWRKKEHLKSKLGNIWNKVSPLQKCNYVGKQVKDVASLEGFVDRVFYSKDIFRKVLGDHKSYYPYFYSTVIEDIITHNRRVKSVAISSDNRFVVSGFGSGFDRGTVKLYDMVTKQTTTITTHNSRIRSVAISSDNKFIVSGSHDGTAELYDMVTKQTTTITTHNDSVRTIAISSDNRFVVLKFYETVKLYNMVTKKASTIITHARGVRSVAISSDNKFIVLGLTSGLHDGMVKLYDMVTKQTSTIITHNGRVKKIAISSDNKFIVSGFYDGTAKLYDIETKQTTTITTHNDRVKDIAISSDNRFVVLGFVSGFDRGIVKLYDMVTKQTTTIITHASGVRSVAISGDNRFIVLGFYGTVKVYDMVTKKASTIITHNDRVRSVAISSDNRFVVLGLDSGFNSGMVKMIGNIGSLDDKEFFQLMENAQ